MANPGPRPSSSTVPSHSVRGPLRSRLAASAIKILSPPLAIYLFVKMLAIVHDWRIWLVGPVVLGVGVLMLYGVANSLRERNAKEAMQLDPRPPVVYLRPFRADSRQTASSPEGVREGGIVPDTVHSSASPENAISKALSAVGPFVAVGQPGDWLTPVGGASRLYLSDENWKQVVESLVRGAVAVVLQPESSEGTLWEVNLVARSVDLRRVLFVVPNSQLRPLGFARITELIRQRFGVVLPPHDSAPCDAFYFDRHRRPVPIHLAHDPSSALEPFIALLLELSGSAGTEPSLVAPA
jgi:hypothetical protein